MGVPEIIRILEFTSILLKPQKHIFNVWLDLLGTSECSLLNT